MALLPGMEARLRRLDPRLLARLSEDIPGVARRLVQLRTLFPGADVLILVGHRRVPGAKPCAYPYIGPLQMMGPGWTIMLLSLDAGLNPVDITTAAFTLHLKLLLCGLLYYWFLHVLYPCTSVRALRTAAIQVCISSTLSQRGFCPLSRIPYRYLTPCSVCRRPAVLLAEEFAAVSVAKAALARLFPDSDIDRMVEEQPLLLAEDIELALSEMKRCACHVTPAPARYVEGPGGRGGAGLGKEGRYRGGEERYGRWHCIQG